MIQIHGAKEIEQKLKRLGDPRAVERVLRRSLWEQGRQIRDAARRLAPVRSGTLRKRIRLVRRRMRRGQVTVQVVSRAPHSHLVEYGTGPRTQQGSGRYTGQMPAQPFMRPAWDEERQTAVGTILHAMLREIEREATR